MWLYFRFSSERAKLNCVTHSVKFEYWYLKKLSMIRNKVVWDKQYNSNRLTVRNIFLFCYSRFRLMCIFKESPAMNLYRYELIFVMIYVFWCADRRGVCRHNRAAGEGTARIRHSQQSIQKPSQVKGQPVHLGQRRIRRRYTYNANVITINMLGLDHNQL